jgi:hypothetical protein
VTTMERTLRQFLQAGRLGRIALGASQSRVRRLLGRPDNDGGGWRYGGLRLSFDAGRVSAIALGFQGSPPPSRLRLSGWWPRGAVPFRDVRDYLAREAIPYRMAIPTPDAITLLAGRAHVRFRLEGARTALDAIVAR